MYASTNHGQLLGNQQGERMDKIGEASKPFEARVSDLLEVERRKRDDDEKTVVVYQPKDVEVIDTSAFIKTDMEYGLDSVFRLVDSVNLIDTNSKFRKKVENKTFSSRCCLVSRCLPLSAPAWLVTRRCSSPLTSSLARPPSSSSTPRTLQVTFCFIHPSFQNEFTAEGEAWFDVIADLAASNEFDLELVAASTDSIPVHR